jgi:CrcB protein
MTYYLAIALGGAAGALCRYWLTSVAEHHNNTMFPLGTFVVNLIGSLLIGVLFVVVTEKIQLAAYLRPLLMIGFLGALTTFSTFSLDALLLIQQGYLATATAYILASVVTCIIAAWAGMSLVRLLI